MIELGKWWKGKYGLPLPLGGNVLLRSLPGDIQSECCRLMRESIQYALDNRDEALSYALQFARDLETRLAEKFVGMYVNHYTLDAGEVVPAAVQKLLDMGFEAGLIPRRCRGRVLFADFRPPPGSRYSISMVSCRAACFALCIASCGSFCVWGPGWPAAQRCPLQRWARAAPTPFPSSPRCC